MGRSRCARSSAPTAPRPASAAPPPPPTASSWPRSARRVDEVSERIGHRIKILVGKPGLDGHSNGAEQVALRARDVGMEVIYQGIRLTPEEIAESALQEDVDVVGLSILSGSHLELIPEVVRLLREEDVDVPVVVGGIIPVADAERLREAGVDGVYTPKDFDVNRIMGEIVDLVGQRAEQRRPGLSGTPGGAGGRIATMGDEMSELNGDRSAWLRCYRCWSQNLEIQIHYDAIRRVDPETGIPADGVDEVQEAVVQCLDCMHDQPHLTFQDDRVVPIEDRWERMVAGTPWVASCTVTVDQDRVETCSGPEAIEFLTYGAFGDAGVREFFTHVRFHKHDDEQIVVHLLVELYARSAQEATEVLEEAAQGQLEITSLAEESRPPAHASGEAH